MNETDSFHPFGLPTFKQIQKTESFSELLNYLEEIAEYRGADTNNYMSKEEKEYCFYAIAAVKQKLLKIHDESRRN